jgi:stress-induced-phosphoprotein 1
MEVSEEEKELAARREAAAAEKAKGNEAYKAKRFEEALAHYDAAIAQFDGDISFMTNKWVAMNQIWAWQHPKGVVAMAWPPPAWRSAQPLRCAPNSHRTARAAVRYEMGDYEGCIRDCDEAVARGRELRADYALVGRALARKGNALVKLGRLQDVSGGVCGWLFWGLPSVA